jgi:dCTP deaminase
VILSGEAIRAAVSTGEIVIEPFNESQLGPNSYDFRLGDRCKTYREGILDPFKKNEVVSCTIPPEGCVLSPGRIYLVNTMERMGSTKYVPIIRGRSSIGRLGLFINITSDLIDLGSINQCTLQLVATLPFRAYPGMPVGQVTFWVTKGEPAFYRGRYRDSESPMESLAYQDVADKP